MPWIYLCFSYSWMWHSFEKYKLFATEYFQCVIFFFFLIHVSIWMSQTGKYFWLRRDKCLLHRKFPTDLKRFLFLFYVARIQIQKKKSFTDYTKVSHSNTSRKCFVKLYKGKCTTVASCGLIGVSDYSLCTDLAARVVVGIRSLPADQVQMSYSGVAFWKL